MTITELAILKLLSPSSPPPAAESTSSSPLLTPLLMQNLKTSKEAMESFSGPTHTFHYLHCTHHLDPGVGELVFIIGRWPSIDFHMNTWIPSAQNQELLGLLRGEVEVLEMFHVDLESVDFREREEEEEEEKGRVMVFVVVERWKVKQGMKEMVTKGIERLVELGWLNAGGDGGSSGGGAVGGFRVDTDGKDEFVVFVPCDGGGEEDVQGYVPFVDRIEEDGKQERGRNRDFLEEVDVKYARLLDLDSL